MNIRESIKKMPKVELHLHLDGSVREETVWELLKEQGENTNYKSFEDFSKILSVDGKCESLKEYLKAFEYPVMVMQNKENLKRISRELIEDLSKEGVVYGEIRFAPILHTSKGLTIEQVIEAVIEGINEGEKLYGVKSNLILCAMRGFPLEDNIDVIKKGAQYLNKGVVSADLAGNEHDFPPEESKEVFDLAKSLGYHITIHAGETGREENIIKSIEITHAERIGHGMYAYKNPKIYDVLKEKNVTLEMCPTSNLNTSAVDKLEDHPIRRYFDEGIKVTVNTDNMTVSRITLEEELYNLNEKLGFSYEEIVALMNNAIEASFCDDETKQWIKNKF